MSVEDEGGGNEEMCPSCREFRPVDGDGACRACGSDVWPDFGFAPKRQEDARAWCETCMDHVALDVTDCCERCGGEAGNGQ